ncbi:hypothetical protein STANM309S_06081 [Streptomyces tanashiensis]
MPVPTLAATVLTVGGLARRPRRGRRGPVPTGGTAAVADLVPGGSTLRLAALPPATGDLPARISRRGPHGDDQPAAVLRRARGQAERQGGLRSDGPRRPVNAPDCRHGRMAGISVDSDELVALDESARVHTMDHALNAPGPAGKRA